MNNLLYLFFILFLNALNGLIPVFLFLDKKSLSSLLYFFFTFRWEKWRRTMWCRRCPIRSCWWGSGRRALPRSAPRTSLPSSRACGRNSTRRTAKSIRPCLRWRLRCVLFVLNIFYELCLYTIKKFYKKFKDKYHLQLKKTNYIIVNSKLFVSFLFRINNK